MIGEPDCNGFPVAWRGKVYASQRTLAAHAKCDEQTVRYHLDKHGNIDRLGLMKAKPVNLPPLPWEAHQ
jgi:hypothetical protein